MADINDIAGMLGGLFSSEGEDDAGSGGMFGDIDPEFLIKLLGIVSKLSEDNADTAFLTALRPLLREENRPKLDRAAGILRIMSILPLLRDD
mgnify:CR=1 FL=1